MLKEPELLGIFAVPDTLPMWRAVLQVIDTAETAANQLAQEQSGANNSMCAYGSAGAHHLRLLKQEFKRLREEAVKGKGI